LHRILLVEDDTPVRVIIEHVLLGEGYEVDTAGTAQAGGELLDNGGYDMVIADAKLPDGTGIEIADRAAERAIRTLIITGYAFTLPRESLLRHEMLLKPLRPREIVVAVEQALHENGREIRK
jgi:DNA-binding response OmpR family regulator